MSWVKAQMVYTPVLTFEESLTLSNPAARTLPRFFIRCTGFPYLAAEEQKAIAAHWKTYQLATGHDAMVTLPDALVDVRWLLPLSNGVIYLRQRGNGLHIELQATARYPLRDISV